MVFCICYLVNHRAFVKHVCLFVKFWSEMSSIHSLSSPKCFSEQKINGFGAEMACLWAQQRLLPPTHAFELQEGRGAVTGPLRLIAEREAGFFFLPSLPTPPSAPLTSLFLHLFVCLSSHSIATNYRFSSLLLLIRVFFQYPARSQESQGGKSGETEPSNI